MEKNKSLSERVAVVTGGSVGIGRAIVSKFAQEGAHVAFFYKSHKKEAEELALQTNVAGRKVIPIQCSVENPDDIKKAFDEIFSHWDQIDILVNNAGITRDGLFALLEENQWNEVIGTNLNSIFYTCKQVVKRMIGRKYGRIINITSISGLIGREGQTNYSASKGAIVSFTKSLSREVAKFGITVNAIAPGLINTNMTKLIPKAVLQKSIEEIPSKRMGTPEEVAHAALFLAHESAGFINGAVINVTGGQI